MTAAPAAHPTRHRQRPPSRWPPPMATPPPITSQCRTHDGGAHHALGNVLLNCLSCYWALSTWPKTSSLLVYAKLMRAAAVTHGIACARQDVKSDVACLGSQLVSWRHPLGTCRLKQVPACPAFYGASFPSTVLLAKCQAASSTSMYDTCAHASSVHKHSRTPYDTVLLTCMPVEVVLAGCYD